MTRKLGKLPPRHDPRTYRLSAPLAATLPAVPDAQDWSAGVAYQMWGNDRYGCCAFAAQAALGLTWTQAAQAPVSLSTDMVLANYAAVTGFDPTTGANDNGTILLDQLRAWTRNGFERPGQTRDYLTAYGAIGPKDRNGIKRAIAYLGGVLAGVQVPHGFLDLAPGTAWDITATLDLQPAGGHAIALTGYSPAGVFFNTWGERTFMPWATFETIADEAYGLVSRQNWIGVTGLSPKNDDADALLSQMRCV